MLTSISPLGERARGNRFTVTAAAHVAGSGIGGAAVGAVAGLIGWALLSPLDRTVASGTALAVVAVATLAAVALDHVGVPTVHRQVDERWIGAYRGWVYGAGFGLQLGVGVITIVPSNVVYAALVGAATTGSPAAGAAVGLVFGVVRGVAVLLGRRVRTSQDLARLHRRVATAAPIASRLTAAGAAGVGGAAAVTALAIGLLG
jgi:sulfite exporter TauE/SafE